MTKQGFDEGQRIMRMRRLLDMLPAESRAAMAVLADMAAEMEFDPHLVGDGTGYDFAAEKACFAEGVVWAVAMGASLKKPMAQTEGIQRLVAEITELRARVAELTGDEKSLDGHELFNGVIHQLGYISGDPQLNAAVREWRESLIRASAKIGDELRRLEAQAKQAEQEEKSEQQIVDECNQLAKAFHSMVGYRVPEGFKFYEADSPLARRAWQMAVEAYEHIAKTDVENAVASCSDGG